MRALVLALAGLIATASVAFAEPNPAVQARVSAALERCMDQPGGDSTQGMTACIREETARQDAKLNAAYRTAMAELNPEQSRKLRAAQRAWIAYRDANCIAYQDNDWGTLSQISAADCVMRMTIERTIELEDYPPEG